MAFTETATILRRVEAALEYDLLGQTSQDSSEDDAVNGHLSDSLNPEVTPERVERMVLDPVLAGDLYATTKRTGLTVGFSFAQQQRQPPQGGTGRSLRQSVPVEVTVLRVVNRYPDILGGTAGYVVDNMMDAIQMTFSGRRRKAPNFGVETLDVGNAQQLEGGAGDSPWHGRIMQINFVRSTRALQT